MSDAAAAVGRQLALPFAHMPHYESADLIESACNEVSLAWLRRTEDWPDRRLALAGAEGSGKTHMLHVWARREGGTLLPGLALVGEPFPPTRPIAVDDADMARERPLLHLLNAAAEARLPVVLAGRTPPARWPVALPDLASRLRSILAVQIGPADDRLLRALLARLLAERQLQVPEAVQDWLLARLPRTPAALREAAARLDRAALASGRRIGRAAAAAVLASLRAEGGEAWGEQADEREDRENVTMAAQSGPVTTPILL